jgi:hypothetical protein
MWVGMSFDGTVLPLVLGFAVTSWAAFVAMLYLNKPPKLLAKG